jgi:hypothetical protein
MTKLPDDMKARTPAPEGEAVVCSGCEGHPVFPNVPCAVCGASPVVPVGSAATLERQAAEIERLRGLLGDKRAAFEKWYCDDAALVGITLSPAKMVSLRDGEEYGEGRTALNGKWEGWKARAALTGEDTAGSPTSENTEPGLAFSDACERKRPAAPVKEATGHKSLTGTGID